MLGPDLDTLVRARRSGPAVCERIDTHAAQRPARETFLLRFADGSRLKGRRLATPADALRVHALADRLDPQRFPRIIARHGAALLETWIEGETLAAATEEHARWAGETLRAIHRLPCPPGFQAPREDDLQWLVDAGALEPAAARGLRARAARVPPAGSPAIIHRDLCPENIVVDRDGRLFSIDNAAVRVGAPEEDLGRTLYRWPMSTAEENAFLEAYGDASGFIEFRPYWMVTVLAHAARVRCTRGYARADETLARLRAEAG